jgi:cell shape-determining protein MreC
MRAVLLITLLFVAVASAQSPTPIVVQAANSTAAAKSTTSAPVAPDVHSIPEAIKLLEQIKATNEEVLAKQKAALERLGELQDAADQLRIFAKRG